MIVRLGGEQVVYLLDASLELNNFAIARWAHGHIVSASECRDFLHDRYGVALERVAVVPQAPPEEYRNCDRKAYDRRKAPKNFVRGTICVF